MSDLYKWTIKLDGLPYSKLRDELKEFPENFLLIIGESDDTVSFFGKFNEEIKSWNGLCYKKLRNDSTINPKLIQILRKYKIQAIWHGRDDINWEINHSNEENSRSVNLMLSNTIYCKALILKLS